MNKSEYNLIENAKKGDHEAFNKLFLEEQKFIFNLIYRLTGNPTEASDFTQETLIKAYCKIRTFRYEAKFRTWLSKIAINIIRQNYRSRHRHISMEMTKISDTKGNPEYIFIEKEKQKCVSHCVWQHMPEKYKTVLALRDLYNFSYNEIVNILGWSISKTKTRIHRARNKFRNMLKK